MPLKLDSVDVAILRALSEDGRKSLRQLAKIVNVTTPTVHARLKRMMRTGLISRIAPIYNVDKLDKGVGALIWLKIEASIVAHVTSEFKNLEEVKGIFFTTGEGNLLLKIFVTSYDKIKPITDRITSIKGVHLLSTQMITKTLKDEQGIIIEPDIGILLKCDYCNSSIKGQPSTLKTLVGDRFFCCNTCLTVYKEKYRSRM
ncbi:MAG: AsnC family transcriptional regulator [Candidatus Bathyarchaeota archaeon]|nr:AsnC family transcriptional regulator [Candidatus Bathyarchaeota archaeon]